MVKVRKGSPYVALTEAEFDRRFDEHFVDPKFDSVREELERVRSVAHGNYTDYRKAPHKQKAGSEYADPEYDLSVDWIRARAEIKRAAARHADRGTRSRILLVHGSARNEHTCPGEVSKTLRLCDLAKEELAAADVDVDFLDLSTLTAEYGRVIYPCKACVATAMPLCHWPCSCYPNHALHQTGDWMNEIYPRWVAAHGVLIVTPVYWYQAPSVLKLMMDRLVCADGGNPDPTTTGGKDPKKAKQLELEGWSYPRHLAGRAFSVVVHGDAAGVETLHASLTSWLTDMHLVRADSAGGVARYVGYYEPYATSHDDLDKDTAFQQEVRSAARALVRCVTDLRDPERSAPDAELAPDPRPK